MMMKNYDQSVRVNHTQNWCYILDQPSRIIIFSGSGSGKTNVLLNLMKNQKLDIDNIYLYVKDSFKSKHQLLVNGREKEVLLLLNCFYEEENSTFHLFLCHNLISNCLKL